MYLKTAQNTKRMIEARGAKGVLMYVTRGGYNPSTSRYEEVVESTFNVGCLVTDYEISEVDGISVLRTDKKVLIPALGLPRAPRKGDRLTVQGSTLTVEHCGALIPGEMKILFTVQVR